MAGAHDKFCAKGRHQRFQQVMNDFRWRPPAFPPLRHPPPVFRVGEDTRISAKNRSKVRDLLVADLTECYDPVVSRQKIRTKVRDFLVTGRTEYCEPRLSRTTPDQPRRPLPRRSLVPRPPMHGSFAPISAGRWTEIRSSGLIRSSRTR